jgi:hypothetical protein
MTKIEEPLERGWLGEVLRDVKNEIAKWPSDSSLPKLSRHEPSCIDAAGQILRSSEQD